MDFDAHSDLARIHHLLARFKFDLTQVKFLALIRSVNISAESTWKISKVPLRSVFKIRKR